MDKHLYTVSEEEKYYFDLRGYLVVRNALTAEEVSECNAAIDHFADQISAYPDSLARGSSALQGTTSRQQLSGMLGGRPPTANPFAACWSIPPSSLASTNSAARAFASITAPCSSAPPREPKGTTCTARASLLAPPLGITSKTAESIAGASPWLGN